MINIDIKINHKAINCVFIPRPNAKRTFTPFVSTHLPFFAHAESRHFLAALHNLWLAQHPSLTIALFERKNLPRDLDRVAAQSLTIQNVRNTVRMFSMAANLPDVFA